MMDGDEPEPMVAPGPRVNVLASTPLFASFDAAELDRLAELFVEVTYHAGDTVCRQGEQGDTFFIVVSGELEVWGGAHGETIINRLGPGEVLGEMSLLTGATRAATVTAARDTRLLALGKASFERHLLPNAKVLEYFSQLLCRRLATLARGEVAAKTPLTVGVTGSRGLKGKSFIASALAALLPACSGRETLLVSVASPGTRPSRRVASLAELGRSSRERVASAIQEEASGRAVLTIAPPGESEGRSCAEHLLLVLGRIGERFSMVVLDFGSDVPALEEAVAGVADAVVVVVESPGDPAGAAGRRRTFRAINLHNASSRPIPINSNEPFVIPFDLDLRGLDPTSQAERLVRDPWSPISRVLHRLARTLVGANVGLAIGGGAAFGISHVGVLKVFEDNQIPVDLIVGCSMGSIVALGYAAGIRAGDMVDIARRIGTRWTTLSAVLDFSITRPGLLSGRRLVEIFAPLSGDIQNFDQLLLPCRAVATDIETGERIAIGTGRTDVAFRASSAVPMLWAPERVDGRVLVDGGVADPVPAEVVREMGADLCIAVNAVPPLKKGVDTVLSRLYRRVNTLNVFSYLNLSHGMPSMFDLVMNTMQILQHELGNFKAISADIRINPDLAGHTWIEFYRPEELIARGAEAAERALPEIKRLLGERLTAGARPVRPAA
jgi:NTE family protein